MKLKESALVLYKTQPAVIVKVDTDKIEIELADGMKKVREKDIEFLHAGPVRLLKAGTQASRTSPRPDTPPGKRLSAKPLSPACAKPSPP